MSTAALEAILEQVKELTPEEQQKVRDLLDSLAERTTNAGDKLDASEHTRTKEEALQILLAKVVISNLPSRSEGSPIAKRKRLDLPGKPLSEIIIEERR
jgi:hypothetical protein